MIKNTDQFLENCIFQTKIRISFLTIEIERLDCELFSKHWEDLKSKLHSYETLLQDLNKLDIKVRV